MTDPEMNAPIRKIVMLTAAAAGLSAGLGACAGGFAPETDASSPVAPQVQTLVDAHRRYPRWADFPRQQEPTPEPTAIAAQVNTLKVSGAALAGEAARIEWTLTEDPSVYIAETRARVDAVQVAPATAETAAEIEEFARRTRERGTAPPAVERRPQP